MNEVPEYPVGDGLLKGKRVLVTASAGAGIGLATAKRCAEEGATVILSDLHERRLEEAADAVEQIAGERPLAIPCDVTKQEDVDRLFERILYGGHLDVAVNNAGLGGTANIVDMTDEQWDAVMDVSLKSVFRCLREELKHMQDRGQGAIVNLSSVLAWRAQAGQAHYAAAKAGVAAVTRAAALEAAPFGVRVNAVAPSLAITPFLSKVMHQEELDRLVGLEAYGRAAEPWEVANVIVFLASDLSGYMTGEVVSVSSQHP
jgi:3-oxoacyl-[acyl-carrier protein] reductase